MLPSPVRPNSLTKAHLTQPRALPSVLYGTPIPLSRHFGRQQDRHADDQPREAIEQTPARPVARSVEVRGRGFTPWLALPENLDTLADVRELSELVLVAIEQSVGDFKLGIPCTDGDHQAVTECRLD